MSRGVLSLDPEDAKDHAYPISSPPDPVFPCRTLPPLFPVLAGITPPGIWSRLEAPLGASLELLWASAGLGPWPRPRAWASLHYGRIALNAHGWELLRAAMHGVPPDPALAPPPGGRLSRALDRARERLAPWARSRVRARARGAGRGADRILDLASSRVLEELDLPDLARGPLDDRAWTRILLPWLAEGILPAHEEPEPGPGVAEERAARALSLEQRFARGLGERLAQRSALEQPEDVAYLTVEERLGAVNDPLGPWALHLQSRIRQAREFLGLEVPDVFWGAPRVTVVETR